MNLADYIMQYRREHNLSIREFAKLCGLSHVQIIRMETGMNSNGKPFTPSIKSLKALARGTGVGLDDVLRYCEDLVIRWDRDDVEVSTSPANRTLMAWAASLPPEQAETWCKAFGLTVVP